MSTFRLYLWKEWREQRAPLLALTGMLPLLVLAITFGMHRRQVGLPHFFGAVALLALVVTLLAIGGELLGSDRRAGGQWLERLPAGLAGVFPAKLVLLVLTSILALGYGFTLAALGAFLRGRSVQSPLAQVGEAPAVALVVLGAAALLMSWTFAASAWSGRGMIALIAGFLVLGGVLFVVDHFLVSLGYSPPPLEILAVSLVLVAGGLVSAWAGFVKGRRFGRGLLATAARGIPAGALCVLPLAGWSLHQLRDRTAFDLASPECRVHGAWISGDGRAALLYVRRENEHWDTLPSHVVRVDLEQGTHEALGGPGADFVGHWQELGSEPSQELDAVWIVDDTSGEPRVVLDAYSAAVMSGDADSSRATDWTATPAGHGFSQTSPDNDFPVLLDPYHELEATPSEIGFDWWSRVHIGPSGWLVETWPLWLEYSPDCAELVTADWMDPTATPGPMLADGRLLVHLPFEERFALADLAADILVPLSGPGSLERLPVYLFLQQGGLRAGEPAFVETSAGRHRLDEELLEFVPCDDSYAGELLRWLPDGTLFFLTDDGLFRRAPSGERTCVFALRKTVTP